MHGVDQIERPERFRPEPRILKRMNWRTCDDGTGEGEVWNEARGAWLRVHPMFVELHRGLEEGVPVATIVERAVPLAPRQSRRVADREVRSYLYDMHTMGYVDIPLPPPPEVFAQRYERVKELGRGGMGIAHLCIDRTSSAHVVIKHAWGWTRDIRRADHSIREERDVLAALSHSSIPRLVDSFEEEGLLHIVMEYVLGAALSRARDSPTWTSARRRNVVAQAADALHHVHERGFVYLDAKPGNFILGEGDRLFVLDFGVAHQFGPDKYKMKSPIGTRGFAAPEVRRERVADPRSDQFSLGCVLFYLGVGEPPKPAWTHDEIIAQHARVVQDESERLILARMTATKPDDRFPDLSQARDALLR